jgi:ABC-2 type transport system ATP-binding protein
MKQKLGLAAALLPNPELLILDEPVSALDPVGRRQALELLAALKGKTTVLFSSHILTDVERICQQVVVIKEGRKLADERLTELLSRYGRVCCLKVAGDQKLAQSILRSDEAVAALKTEGERLLATVKPGCLGSFRTRTLQRLLAAGLELCELAPDGEQLERILLKILAEGEQDHEMRLGTEKGLA